MHSTHGVFGLDDQIDFMTRATSEVASCQRKKAASATTMGGLRRRLHLQPGFADGVISIFLMPAPPKGWMENTSSWGVKTATLWVVLVGEYM